MRYLQAVGATPGWQHAAACAAGDLPFAAHRPGSTGTASPTLFTNYSPNAYTTKQLLLAALSERLQQEHCTIRDTAAVRYQNCNSLPATSRRCSWVPASNACFQRLAKRCRSYALAVPDAHAGMCLHSNTGERSGWTNSSPHQPSTGQLQASHNHLCPAYLSCVHSPAVEHLSLHVAQGREPATAGAVGQ
jgi:hypothetical protein